MSLDKESDPSPIEHRRQLVDYFRRGEKSPDQRGIGTEHEKFVIRRSNASMLSFEEPGGFGDLFNALATRFCWEPTPADDGNVVAVVGNEQAITLEPGGQFELSGAITDTIFETADEFDEHLRQLEAVADDDLIFAIWGMNPAVGLDDVPWMPKKRYQLMRDYLPTRGKMAHWMMKTTCTVQANFDYCSESDAVDLIHTAVLASPVVGALFANSPVQNGRDTGFQSRRNFVWWNHTDPDRTGVPSFMYRTDWGYEDYLDYALDVPMFFIRRHGEYVDMTGHCFRQFIDDGFRGFTATMGDFELHLSTLFPDVRLKQFIEVRSADGGPRESVLALPAIWKGLLYDSTARGDAASVFESFTQAEHRQLVRTCYRDGLHGDSPHGSVHQLASRLVTIAEEGLERIADDADHRSEASFLAPLIERLDHRRSWADELLDDVRELDADLVALAERWAL